VGPAAVGRNPAKTRVFTNSCSEPKVVPKVSQEILAEMVGTTRARINFFMNKFRRLGFIKYNGKLQINDSLLSVVFHD